jgi:hypothetical protein
MRTDGQTNRHDETGSRFSQLCERVKKDEFTIFTLFLLHLIKNLSHRKNVHTNFVDFNELFV